MALEDEYRVSAILCRVTGLVNGEEETDDIIGELEIMRGWLTKDPFDARTAGVHDRTKGSTRPRITV